MECGCSGVNVERKLDYWKRQVQYRLKESGYADKLDLLDFQIYGRPDPYAKTQAAATSL